MIRCFCLILALQPLLSSAAITDAGLPGAIELLPRAQVTSAGVHLHEVGASLSAVLPKLRLAPAPRLGQTLVLDRAAIETMTRRAGCTNLQFTGPQQIRIARQTRQLEEEEVKLLLMAQLQSDLFQDRGELDLRFTRPWATIPVPDEPLSLRVTDLPASGVTPLFICRVEILCGSEIVGAWQVSLAAKVWRDVWITRTPLRRGALLAEADLARERRDILGIREPLADFATPDLTVELAEYVPANAPLQARSLKPRPAVRRGQSAHAFIQDGALSVSMKVEIMEDGLPGQLIRIRNPHTRRELRGRVQNEQTIIITL